MNKITLSHICTFILLMLAFGLPLHGALTAFGPDWIRWWKEILLGFLTIFWFVTEWKSVRKHKFVSLDALEKCCLGYLVWLFLLVFASNDLLTTSAAARYLGLGFIVFLLVHRIFRVSGKPAGLPLLSRGFVLGCLISTLFGFWAHFFGGYEVLQNWYATTISSWVPGQTIPIYHETGHFIRLQGTSSGPVEYGHLLFLALVLLPFTKWEKKTSWIVGGILLLGLALSLTRGAWLALAFYAVVYFWQQRQTGLQVYRFTGMLIGLAATLIVFLSFAPQLRENILSRAGTTDHFVKPVEVFKRGMEHPITGDLGSVGPAARAKNLREINDDRAPIAENVFIDIFAQTGIIGLLFIVFFWWNLGTKNAFLFRFVGATFLTANLATIFDMSPLSISFFLAFALLSSKR